MCNKSNMQQVATCNRPEKDNMPITLTSNRHHAAKQDIHNRVHKQDKMQPVKRLHQEPYSTYAYSGTPQCGQQQKNNNKKQQQLYIRTLILHFSLAPNVFTLILGVPLLQHSTTHILLCLQPCNGGVPLLQVALEVSYFTLRQPAGTADDQPSCALMEAACTH